MWHLPYIKTLIFVICDVRSSKSSATSTETSEMRPRLYHFFLRCHLASTVDINIYLEVGKHTSYVIF